MSTEAVASEPIRRKVDAAVELDGPLWIFRLSSALSRHRGKILLLMLAATTAMTAYVVTRPNVYVAYSEILVGEHANPVADIDDRSLERLPEAPHGHLGSAAKLIGSALIIEKVIDEIDLDVDQGSPFDPRDLWQSLVDQIAALEDDQRSPSHRLEALRSRLEINADPSTSVIRISYRSTDPEVAAKAVDGLAQAFLEHRAETRRRSIQQAARQVQRRAETIPGSIDGTGTSSAASPAARATSPIERRRARLSEELTNATLKLADTRARLAEIEAAGTSGAILDRVANTRISPEGAELLARDRELRRQIRALSDRSDDGDADLIRAETDYALLQETLEEESARVVETFRLKAHAAETHFEELQEKLEDVETELSNVRNGHPGSPASARQGSGSPYVREAVVELGKRAGELAAVSFDTTQIIEPATIPSRPSMVSGVLLIGLTCLGTGGLGLIGAVLVELKRKGFGDASEVEGYLGLPLLGLLPNVHGVVPLGARIQLSSREKRWALESYAFIEGVRGIFNTLLPPGDKGAPATHRVVAVTSCFPDEGKTILALSLARQSASGGAKVLLIEGDMRKVGLATRLSTVSPKKGLVDLLSGRVDRVDDIIVEETESGADLLLASGPSEEAFTHSRSPLLKKTISDLRKQYDLIIVDCPPVLGVSETLTLCDEADEILFVIRWQETHRAATRSAIRDLQPRPIAGVVLTQVDLADHLKHAKANRYRYQDAFKSYAVSERQT